MTKKFGGRLDTPIKLPLRPEFPTISRVALGDTKSGNDYNHEEQVWSQRCVELVNAERVEKLKLLFEHYEIDGQEPHSWQSLAIKLAYDLVPGFQYQLSEKPGSKRKWDQWQLARLHFEVEDVLREKRALGQDIKTTDAFRFLCSRKSSEFFQKDEKTLRNKYAKAKKHDFVKFLAKNPHLRTDRGPFSTLLMPP